VPLKWNVFYFLGGYNGKQPEGYRAVALGKQAAARQTLKLRTDGEAVAPTVKPQPRQ
jgi:hypothetical protein